MKLNKTIFAMCCVAALTACSNDDEVTLPAAGQPHEMSITVSSGADTRTTLTADGDALTRVWAEGDQISVIFQKDDTNYNEVFTLTAGAGTTQGTFSKSDSEIPTTGTQTVHLQFPAGTTSSDNLWVDTSIAEQDASQNVGNYDVLGIWKGQITDGSWSALSLSSESTFLHIPTDVQLIEGVTSVQTVSKVTLSGTNIAKEYSRNFNGTGNTTAGSITVTNVPDLTAEGKLAKDLYIAFLKGSGGEPKDVKLTFTIGGTDYAVELNDRSTSGGKVYHLAESSIKTKPSM